MSHKIWGSNRGCMEREGVWMGNVKGVTESHILWEINGVYIACGV